MKNDSVLCRKGKLTLDLYYNMYTVQEHVVQPFASGIYHYPEKLWYMPSPERFDRIVADGFALEGKDLMELRKLFQDEYYLGPNEIYEIGKSICKRIHLGWEQKDIVENVLSEVYLFNKKKMTKNLNTFLEKIWEDIARAVYLGNTPRAWKMLTKQ